VRQGLSMLRRHFPIAVEPPLAATGHFPDVLYFNSRQGTLRMNSTKRRGLIAKSMTQMISACRDLFYVVLFSRKSRGLGTKCLSYAVFPFSFPINWLKL
jgi:hypothetical protein